MPTAAQIKPKTTPCPPLLRNQPLPPYPSGLSPARASQIPKATKAMAISTSMAENMVMVFVHEGLSMGYGVAGFGMTAEMHAENRHGSGIFAARANQ